jgi:hypothetical protein
MAEKQFQVKLLEHNIVEVILKDNVYLDISITDSIDQALNRIAPDRKFYQMVIANGPYIVNPEMRNSMAEGDTGNKLLAVAWVSPDIKANLEQESIVSQLTLPIPVRFFSEREKGLAWLKSLASQG